METDVQLKVLARQFPQDMLRLIGDREGTALSAEVLELQAVRRTVDFVIAVERDGETYYQHLEFQAEPDPDMASRCFRYNAQLLLQLKRPVLTTVLYLLPPGPPPGDLVFRVVLAGQEMNIWRFGVVRLWEVDAKLALASGSPGLLALVPFMKGGRSRKAIVGAGNEIERIESGSQRTDAFVILLQLAAHHYNVKVLTRWFGRRKMIQSSIWQAAQAEGKAEGRAEGKAEGALANAREFCREQVRKHHPALVESVWPLIDACDDVGRLKAWFLGATDYDDEGFARFLGLV
jgi:predicted transposase YdaD